MVLSLFSFPVQAEEKGFFDNSIILLVDSPKCYVNGELKPVGDVAPTIVNDRTLVPVRFLTESFGGTVEWDGATRTATLTYGSDTIDVPIDQNKIVVNGEEKALDVGASIIDDRTMLPVRAISEALGKTVGYDSGIISLTDNDVEDYDKNEPYAKRTMDAIRKKLSLERDGKTISVPTKFSFGALDASSGVLTFSEKDLPYVSKTDSYAVCGNIYIEDLTIKKISETERKMTFDAYNYDYVYGIAEVYDENDNLKSYKMISPFGGMWTSLSEYGVAVYNLGVGISDWVKTGNSAYFTYRNETQTTHTPIEVIVPKNGYVLVTANPSMSERLSAYDVAEVTTKTISLALSSISGLKDKDAAGTFVAALQDELTGTISDALIENPKLYSEIVLLLSGDADPANSDKNAKELAKKLINVLEKSGVDILENAEEIAADLLAGSGEAVLKEVASLFVDGGIGTALDAMSMINSGADFVCLVLDLQYSVSKGSLVLKLQTDDLKVYTGTAKLAGKTITGTKSGFIYTNSLGETKTLVSGDFEYDNFVTDGNDLYYYDVNTLAIYHINIEKGTREKVSNVFQNFNSYYRPQDGWSKEDCYSGGRIEAYHNGKLYFEECGGFETFPTSIIDVKTGAYQLTPLRNVGRYGFYKDKFFYMIQTGSFDLSPMYIANTDGTGSRLYKENVWRFLVCDNILYVCAGVSTSYTDYDKGNVYAINLDDNSETLIYENIKASTGFEPFVLNYHAANH